MPVSPISNGGSSNGRTADSDSANTGSNPVPPAIPVVARRVPDASKNIPTADAMPIGSLFPPTERIGMTAKRVAAVVPEYTDRPEMCCSD